MGKGGSVTNALNQKVYNLIHDLLQDKSDENKKNNDGDENKWFLNYALARDLRRSEVLSYLLDKDILMRRYKRSILENTIDIILKTVREDEQEELAEVIKLQNEYELKQALSLIHI